MEFLGIVCIVALLFVSNKTEEHDKQMKEIAAKLRHCEVRIADLEEKLKEKD